MKVTGILIVLILAAAIVGIQLFDSSDNAQLQGSFATSTEAVTTVAENLDTPWAIAFLPNGDTLVAERPGTLRVIGSNPVEIEVLGVEETAEGGLLGIALHPEYENNKFLYIYFTTYSNSDRNIINRVVKYVFDGKSISNPVTVIDNIPAGSNHNGGQIAFGPDKLLYITTGDAGNSNLAQNTSSLAGKMLRLRDDGSIPADNPFTGSAVYSYGHRNPQGITWDKDGGLWATEHGRSGIQSGYDEVNYIEKGANYGWPTIQGDQTKVGMKSPVIHSGADITWAPGGIAYKDDTLYFTGLRGETLYSASITASGKAENLKEHFVEEFGRLRAIMIDANGSLFVSTSNRDGRGNPEENDDRILKLTLE